MNIFKEAVKDYLIDNYQEHEGVNYSLLKQIAEGNFEAIRSGIPKTTSTYMDFGSYVDKTISEGFPPVVHSYPHTELTGHSLMLAEGLVKRNIPNADIDKRLP